VRFHFKGWSSKYDEWVPLGEYVHAGVYADEGRQPRIAPLNLYTNAGVSNPREQERWQGANARLNIKDKDAEATAKKKAKLAASSSGRIKGGSKGTKRPAGSSEAAAAAVVAGGGPKKKAKRAAKIDWGSVIY
jgi:hypothetical protein